MLVHDSQISDILYYEVLDSPLPELQGLKTLKVAIHHTTKDEVVIYTIRLPKNSTVGDIINDLKTKVELSHPNAELRLLAVFYHKITIFSPSEKIQNVNDQFWTLRAEEIPEEEKNLGPHDRLIHVYHFMKDPDQNQMQVQNFGEPFFLIIHEGETLAAVKLRVQKKLQVPDEEFAKWKFAFVSIGRPEYLQDSDVVSSRFQRRNVYGDWEQYLGLEHADTSPKRAYTANQRRNVYGDWEQYLGLEHADASPKRAYTANQRLVCYPISGAVSKCTLGSLTCPLCEDSSDEETSPQDKTPEEQRGEVTKEEPSWSVQRDEDQGMRAESSMPIDLPSEPESREGLNSAPSTSAPEPAPAPSSSSLVDASTPQSIKVRLPRCLASLTSQQVKKLLVEARVSGQQELYARLTSLFGLLEEFEFATKHPPSDVQAQLIKAREATELYNKQREELLASLATIKLEAAQLKDALVKAEGRVVELEHALLTLAPPDPHAVDGLQLEADRQEAIGKRIQGRLIQLEAEYESFLNGLH